MGSQERLSEELRTRLHEEAGVKVEVESIRLDECGSYADSLRTTVEILIDEGRLTSNDLPYQAGPTYNLLATKPRHQDGVKMILPTEISEGIYLECNFNQDRIRRLISNLVDDFGT